VSGFYTYPDHTPIQGVAQCLAHALQPIQYTDCRKHMRGIGTLAAPRLEQFAVPTPLQKDLQQQLFRTTGDQASTKFTQHRMVKARISQF